SGSGLDSLSRKPDFVVVTEPDFVVVTRRSELVARLHIHHSPSRIEVVTSFHKHPIEILSDAMLSAVVLHPLLGSSLMGLFRYNFFAGGSRPRGRKSANCQAA